MVVIAQVDMASVIGKVLLMKHLMLARASYRQIRERTARVIPM